VRNESEKKHEYQIDGWRYVRQETTFTVQAADEDEAQELAQEVMDSDGCDWRPDYECPPCDEDFHVLRIDAQQKRS